MTSCFNDLNTIPADEDVITSEQVYDNPEAYKQVLAKLYAGLALTGQQGPAGKGDIEGIDEGFGQYLRMLFYHQEFTTDEAVVGWNDQTIKDFHEQDWADNDGFVFAMYSRIYYQIPLANEFLRETTDAKLNERGVDDALKTEIQGFRAEARFLRALSYWHALDLFRNVPFVTEDDPVGSFFPEQISAVDLFAYLEAELLDIENKIADVRTNEYGRADQGAVWALLSKLYLNAEVYTGQARYEDCLTYCDKILSAGYALEENYQNLFLADNHLSDEIIFPIAFDGINTRTWGGMTFIIRAAIGGSMTAADSGVKDGWGGTRTTRQLVDKFGEIGGVLVEPNAGSTAQYPKLYVPASYNDFDFSDLENALSSVENDNVFQGYKYFPSGGGSFLLSRIPDASAPYFGDNGGDGSLDQFGDEIQVAEEGLYYFEVDLNDNTYTLEKQEWGVIGDATEGSWDSDTDMEWSDELNALRVIVNGNGGEFKFRANDAWDINLGDTNADAILDFDGDNISLPAGEFEIVLYIGKPDYTYSITLNSFDTRPLFYSDGQNLDIDDITQFNQGYAVVKFKNVDSNGNPGSDSDFPDTDFPVFRLADVHLMAAEAALRTGASSQSLDYLNPVRNRAFKSSAGHISESELSLDFILDERARELYWECHRRTDLVRFGQFSDGEYLWQWKGGLFLGTQVPDFRNVFPIPSADLAANPNLIQNEGY